MPSPATAVLCDLVPRLPARAVAGMNTAAARRTEAAAVFRGLSEQPPRQTAPAALEEAAGLLLDIADQEQRVMQLLLSLA